MNKKAVSLSINSIIIAIIGLIVLFVLIGVFTGKISLFQESTDTCYSKGGTCSTDKIAGSCEEGTIKMFTKDCKFYPATPENKNNKLGQCCVKVT